MHGPANFVSTSLQLWIQIVFSLLWIRFLKCLCAEQGYRFEASEGARQLNVPVQQNESDCGLCMLQNVEMYFRVGAYRVLFD